MGQGRGWSGSDLLLVGRRVRVRALEQSAHVAAWQTWLTDPEVARWMEGEVGPAPLMLGIERLEDGALIGGIAFCDVSDDRRAELVIAIGDPASRGLGFGREAVQLVTDHALAGLGLREVFLRVRPDNRRAIRCYLACGFAKEGQLARRVEGGVGRRILLMTRRAG